MGNINAIGVAALADLACIVLTDRAVLDKPALEKARQNAVTVLSTDRNTYEIAAAISSPLPADA
jgi:BioD-like phosphotransacetylase family protein